jgi:hypothetical protein
VVNKHDFTKRTHPEIHKSLSINNKFKKQISALQKANLISLGFLESWWLKSQADPATPTYCNLIQPGAGSEDG